jgi:hypothetical protein
MDGALGGQSGELILAETLTPRVGQQPIEAAGKMSQMETNRRGPAGLSPELIGSEVGHDRQDIFAQLKEDMGSGLKQRLYAVHWPAKPDFRRQGHSLSLLLLPAAPLTTTPSLYPLVADTAFLPASLQRPDTRHRYSAPWTLDTALARGRRSGSGFSPLGLAPWCASPGRS